MYSSSKAGDVGVHLAGQAAMSVNKDLALVIGVSAPSAWHWLFENDFSTVWHPEKIQKRSKKTLSRCRSSVSEPTEGCFGAKKGGFHLFRCARSRPSLLDRAWHIVKCATYAIECPLKHVAALSFELTSTRSPRIPFCATRSRLETISLKWQRAPKGLVLQPPGVATER